jgi:hypothetical protein
MPTVKVSLRSFGQGALDQSEAQAVSSRDAKPPDGPICRLDTLVQDSRVKPWLVSAWTRLS